MSSVHALPPQGDRLPAVQALRGLAALLVLVGHAHGTLLQAAAMQGVSLRRWALPGGMGVDLFFCISGFIMVVASQPLYARPGAAGHFLRRRTLRLVPLYWLATGLFLVTLVVGRHGLHHVSWADLAASLLFVPYPVHGVAAQPYPLLSLGWSLNYEIFFYALFAVFIAMPLRRAVACTVAALVLIVVAGAWVPTQLVALHFWSRPILLEFGMGCAIAWWWLHANRGRGGAATAWVAAVMALSWLALDPFGLTDKPAGASTPNDLVRVLGWGLPAAALLASTLMLQEHTAASSATPMRWLGRLGDWSYSLYLMHPFALVGSVKLWSLLALHEVLPWPVLGLAMLGASVLLAVGTYHLVERPMLLRMRPARVACAA